MNYREQSDMKPNSLNCDKTVKKIRSECVSLLTDGPSEPIYNILICDQGNGRYHKRKSALQMGM